MTNVKKYVCTNNNLLPLPVIRCGGQRPATIAATIYFKNYLFALRLSLLCSARSNFTNFRALSTSARSQLRPVAACIASPLSRHFWTRAITLLLPLTPLCTSFIWRFRVSPLRIYVTPSTLVIRALLSSICSCNFMAQR